MAKDGVIPSFIHGCHPARLAGLTGVFKYRTQTGVANHVIRSAEDPHARLVHFYESVGALARTNDEHYGGFRRSHRIAIESEHIGLMTGQGNAAILYSTGVQKPY